MIAHADTYRFSVEEYHKLNDAGIFDETDRVELLDGEIIIMASIGKHHANSVRRLLNRLVKLLGDLCLVDCQNAFILDDFSEPQPDILLVRLEVEKTGELPRPEDILLVVEVADTTLRFDSTTKLRAYARAGLAEYWIVNLAVGAVEVFRNPTGEGYAEHFQRGRHETLAPTAFPDRTIAVADILP